MGDWNWGEIVSVIIGTGIFTTALNQAATWVREAWFMRRHARHLAVSLAIMLENFAEACSDLLDNHELFETSKGHAGDGTAKLPDLPEYPDDSSGWRALAPDLADRALSLRGHVAYGTRTINFWFDVGEVDQAPVAAQEQAALVGHKAWALASDLRRRYGYRPAATVHSYSEDLAERAARVRWEHGRMLGLANQQPEKA